MGTVTVQCLNCTARHFDLAAISVATYGAHGNFHVCEYVQD